MRSLEDDIPISVSFPAKKALTIAAAWFALTPQLGACLGVVVHPLNPKVFFLDSSEGIARLPSAQVQCYQILIMQRDNTREGKGGGECT